MRIVKDILTWILWYPVRWVVQRLPLTVSYKAANIAGILYYLLSRKKRRLMGQELALIYSGKRSRKQIDKIIKHSFIIYCKNQIEVFLYPVLTPSLTQRMTNIKGLEYVDNTLKGGKGVILALAHFGNNQLIMPAFGHRGYEINQLSAPATTWENMIENQSKMSKRALKIRTEHENLLPVKHINVLVSIRPAFRCLRDNKLLGFAVDGGGGNKRIKVDFLNRKALLPPGVVELAIRTGAVLLPTFVVRQKDNSHQVYIKNAVELQDTGDRDRDLKANMQKIADIIEKYVYAYPDHYVRKLWMMRHRADKDTFPFFTDYAQFKVDL